MSYFVFSVADTRCPIKLSLLSRFGDKNYFFHFSPHLKLDHKNVTEEKILNN